MVETDDKGRGRRRMVPVALLFVAGAAVGAVLFAALDGSRPFASGSSSSATPTVSTQAGNVVRSTGQFDAQTVYKQDSPGVVDITATVAAPQDGSGGLSPFAPGSGSQQAQAEGTGFVYDASGDIVTAEHVVSGATAITVKFSDGTTAKATVVGSDPSTDTAVIKVSTSSSKLTPLALADSSAVEPGEAVVAIGSPFGYAGSITAGIVSAVDRGITAPNGYTIPNAIQTDAAINHGNSGGPLIDSSGNVVGINVQIPDDGQGSVAANAGVGFAVPSNSIKTVVHDLIAGKRVSHSYLGVSVGDSNSGPGAEVGTVRADSPAAAAGLEAGDVIHSVDGTAIVDANQLTAVLAERQPGDKVSLTIERNGKTLTVVATLGTRPATTTT